MEVNYIVLQFIRFVDRENMQTSGRLPLRLI